MSTEKTENKSIEESFDITGLLLSFLANWKWFVLSIVLCLVAAYFYNASKIPLYQVNASIYLSDDQSTSQNAFNISSAADPLVAMKSFIDETELEVLKSRNNVIRIVDSLGLAYNYYAIGRFRDIPLYENNAIIAKLDEMSLRSLKSPIAITVEPVGKSTFNVRAETHFNGIKEEKVYEATTLPLDIELSHGTVHLSRSQIIEYFSQPEKVVIYNPRAIASQISGSLSIEFVRNSNKIIRVSLLTNVIKKGDDIIDALLDFYNRNIIEDKNRSAIQTEAFILDRLVMITDELRDVENRLKDYRQAHNITNIDAQSSMNLSLKTGYEQDLAQADAEMDILNEIERIVSSSDTYETLPAAANNAAIAQTIETYNRKVSNLNRTLEGSTTDNPLVVSMRDELSRDKVRILQNIESAKRNLSTKRSTISKLENRSASALASAPTIDKGLQEIFREQQVKVNIYTFLLQRREEIALQKTLATNTARLIDDPIGYGPVSPQKSGIYGMALLIGLLIPALIIFVKRMLFPVFSDKEDLERVTKVPIIGEICVNNAKEKEGIVVGENVSTPIAELFRLLRNNISFTRGGNENKVILVTSAISGEGKTFIAINLGMTYALMGKKTLIMGLDLRRPMLARRMGFDNHKGITSYLSGQNNDIDDLLLQSSENPNLYIVPAGPVPPNPNELLMSDKMEYLMTTLRSKFDYIIIDSAPIGVISDSYLLTRYSNIQLFVTRANYTSKNNLKLLHQGIANGILGNAYIVINDVDIRSNAYVYRRYGDYGRYGKSRKHVYGYGYNSQKK